MLSLWCSLLRGSASAVWPAILSLVAMLCCTTCGSYSKSGVQQDASVTCESNGKCRASIESRHSTYSQTSCVTMPDVRPEKSKRTFASAAVEEKIAAFAPRFKSQQLAALFSNCLPNTLDTTVYRYTEVSGEYDSFIVTGDIEAMWLRDSTNQVMPYLRLVSEGDTDLVRLFHGLIQRQAKSVLIDPYANAFTLHATDVSPHGDDLTSYPAFAGSRHQGMKRGVFERKYEIDSLANVLFLSGRYYDATKSLSPFDHTWEQAVESILDVVQTQLAEIVGETNQAYTFQRAAYNPTDTLSHGTTWPNRRTGLIRSAFRPSDDATTFPYNIPGNAFMAMALRSVAPLLKASGKEALEQTCLSIADGVQKAIYAHGVVKHQGQEVFAYEVDGFGNHLFMDDSNMPSLLSLPVFGFVNNSDPLYLATRALVLSHDSNPFFFQGPAGRGVGGPHVGPNYIWPMSIMVEAWTAQTDTEILNHIDLLVNSSACTGVMHESFHVSSVFDFTRPWFAWANSLFGDLILKIADERPHLIFHD